MNVFDVPVSIPHTTAMFRTKEVVFLWHGRNIQ